MLAIRDLRVSYGIYGFLTGLYGTLRESAITPAMSMQSVYGKMQFYVVIMQYNAIVYGIYGVFLLGQDFPRIFQGLCCGIFFSVYGAF
jgi:hypothetical protein